MASFAFGTSWYSPVLFLKVWMRESGITPEQHQKNPVRVFGSAFGFTIISCFALALWVGPAAELSDAVTKSLLAGGGLIAASMGINYQFANRSFQVWLTRLVIAGVILDLWH